ASVTFSVNYTAPVANAGVVIANTVTVNAADDEGDSADGRSTDLNTCHVVTSCIGISKTHKGTINEGTAGQVLTYSFTVSNPSTAPTDPVTVSSLSHSVLDDLFAPSNPPSFPTRRSSDLASVTFSVNYTAPVANAGVVIANTVTVNAADDEGDS